MGEEGVFKSSEGLTSVSQNQKDPEEDHPWGVLLLHSVTCINCACLLKSKENLKSAFMVEVQSLYITGCIVLI